MRIVTRIKPRKNLLFKGRLIGSRWTRSAAGGHANKERFTRGVTSNAFCNCTILLRIQFVYSFPLLL